MHARDLVQSNSQLLSLPEVCLRIQQLADDPYADMSEFAQLVAQDPALTIRLLRLVNSACYGFPGRVDTISRAVNLVGIAELRNLTLAMAAMEVFGGLENERFDMLAFWRHSVYCALVGRFLARRARVLHAERLFIIGLLHDVGRLLVFNLLPEQAARIEQRVLAGAEICAAERAELGFDHAEVGYELLSLWQLPKPLRIAVALHHLPEVTEEAQMETAIAHLANGIAHQVETIAHDRNSPHYDSFGGFTDAHILDDVPELLCIDALSSAAWQLSGLTREVLPAAVEAAANDFEEVLNVLYTA